MRAFAIIAAALVAATAAALCVYGLVWLLWCWVWPQIVPTAPPGFLRPDFWLFAGAWLLVSLLTGGARRAFTATRSQG